MTLWEKATEKMDENFIPRRVKKGDEFTLINSGNVRAKKLGIKDVTLEQDDKTGAPLFKCSNTGKTLYINWWRLRKK